MIEESVTAEVDSRRRTVVLNVPSPERCALHELLLFTARPSTMATKAHKDRNQAMQLLTMLIRRGSRWAGNH
ncbi:MAG: hypothetical protein N838_27130 [Thiohalocapsa sp. PB-PSB1]|nr:MAG: hypothetical protein N838_27130 [Thiohalocapsa sp. PB-PSB1]